LEQLARFRAAPRCGASRKRDGLPCRNPAFAQNGRCGLHGGATPKADGWHKPRWPGKNSRNGEVKLARKLGDRERAAKKRARCLAAMSPEQRAAHDAWHKTHPPGPSSRRAADRARRQSAEEIRATLAKPERPLPDEWNVLEESRRALLQRLHELHLTGGVFD
jgi:hypothetical protein